MTDTTPPAGSMRDLTDAADRTALTDELAAYGSASTGRLLTPAQ